MQKKLLLITLIITCCSALLCGQDQKQPTDEELDFIYQITYGMGKLLIEKPEKYFFKEEKFIPEEVTDYNSIQLSKKDLGKEFTLAGNLYRLKYIYDNKVVLEILKPQESEVDIINLSKNGKNKFVPYSVMEFLKKYPEEEENFWKYAGGPIKITIPKSSFEYFKNNPNITLEEYKAAFPYEELNAETPENEKYLIFHTASPVDYNFILYAHL